MLEVTIEADAVRIGERLGVSFHRTLRLPEDGSTHPLPPGLGRLPIIRVRLPEAPAREALAVPLYRREAMWIGFAGTYWKPNAVKVVVGGINAVTGSPDVGRRLHRPQDYLVCPDQPWLDGFNAGDGAIRQFVAMPLGLGYAAEASHGRTERGGVRLVAYESLPGRFSDEPPPEPPGPTRLMRPRAVEAAALGIGAGGRMRQKLYPDPYGLEVWDQETFGEVELAIVDAHRFAELTGRAPPPTPIDAATYTAHGLPWFDLYDEELGNVAPTGDRLKTVAERDAELGLGTGAEPGLGPTTPHIRTLRRRPPSGVDSPEKSGASAAPSGGGAENSAGSPQERNE